MGGPGRTLALPRAFADTIASRFVARVRRKFARAEQDGLEGRAPASVPSALPFIATAPDWPPLQHALDLAEFALLPARTRAEIAAIVEPALARLRVAVVEWLMEAPRQGKGELIIAQAIAGRVGELAGLIEAVECHNANARSHYRIEPGLKSFLVKCAIAEVAESAGPVLADETRSGAAIAA